MCRHNFIAAAQRTLAKTFVAMQYKKCPHDRTHDTWALVIAIALRGDRSRSGILESKAKIGDANGATGGYGQVWCLPTNRLYPRRKKTTHITSNLSIASQVGRACMLHLDGLAFLARDVSCQLSTQAQVMADRLSLCLERRILMAYSWVGGRACSSSMHLGHNVRSLSLVSSSCLLLA